MDALVPAAVIAAVGTAICSLEWLYALTRPATAFLFQVATGVHPTTLRDGLRGWGVVIPTLLLLRFCSVAIFLLMTWQASDGYFNPWLLLIAGLSSLPLRLSPPRGIFIGMNGAEEMLTTTLLLTGASLTLRTPFLREVALAFLAGRAAVEYWAAGIGKLIDWRGWFAGEQLKRVLASSSYGNASLLEVILKRPWIGGSLSLLVIATEIAVPFAVVVPQPVAYAILFFAALFHLATGVIMGLNTFIFAMAASFPALLYWNTKFASLTIQAI